MNEKKMDKVLATLIAIMIFISGIFLGGLIFRIVYLNGYMELTNEWQKTCDDIQNKCDENCKDY